MPCYDGENINFKGNFFYIRCDAATPGYLSFAIFKRLRNVSDAAEKNFTQAVEHTQT
jgi:hypothetical protein